VSKNRKQIRLYLFTHSYSGEKIVFSLKHKYKGKKLTNIIDRLSVILNFNNDDFTDYVMFDKRPNLPYRRVPKALQLYLEIEKELIKISEEKLDEYSTTTEDYQGQLLCPAIERAVGNFLTDVKNDNRFQMLMEENLKSAYYTYYKVVDKYKLPTMRTIPFLLRIIS